MASVAVILLSYGRAADTVECIRSIERSRYTDWEIIVVDNASPDGAADLVAAACPGIRLLRNTRNLGFAEGNNIGIREALNRGARSILLLNNDTVVDPGMLGSLVGAAAQPGTGAVGAKIFYASPPTTLWYAGGSMHVPSATTSHHGIGRADDPAFNRPATCSFITGCAILIPAEVLSRVGLLDPDFFAYLEDADFCYRVRSAGYQLRYEPSAVLHHKVSSTTSWDSPGYLYLNTRNKILFLRKHCLPLRWLGGLPRILYYVVRQLIRATFVKRSPRALRAVLYGITDGVRSTDAARGPGRLDVLGRTPRRSGHA